MSAPERRVMRRIWSSDEAVCELRRQLAGGLALDLADQLGQEDPRPEAALARLNDLLAQAAIVGDSTTLRYAAGLIEDLSFVAERLDDLDGLRIQERLIALSDLASAPGHAVHLAAGSRG